MENSELEVFRQQWREEVSNRIKSTARGAEKTTGPTKSNHAYIPPKPSASRRLSRDQRGSFDGTSSTGLHSTGPHSLPVNVQDVAHKAPREPTSALEHYEKGVEKEAQGNMGDSLKHYLQAYKVGIITDLAKVQYWTLTILTNQLDSAVEKTYKKKHFPGPQAPPKPNNTTVIEPALPPPKSSSKNVPTQSQVSSPSISDLIDSFAALSIPAAPVPSLSDSDDTNTTPETLPCPFSTLPSEVLLEILHHAAQTDMSTLSRLSQVCKRLAYLIATEDSIWKHLVCGSQVGFGGMHYTWACNMVGKPLLLPPWALESLVPPTYLPVPLTPSYPTFRHTLHHRPRIRFNGCYISTVNYARPGAASTSQISWNSPVHIVTYYRYLRFFRDGTLISLVSTHEPSEIVPRFTKENTPFSTGTGAGVGVSRSKTMPSGLLLDQAGLTPPEGKGSGHENEGGSASGTGATAATTTPLPASVFHPAVRGRWHMSGCPILISLANDPEQRLQHEQEHGCTRDNDHLSNNTITSNEWEPDHARKIDECMKEGEIYILTESLDRTYLFKMHLALTSTVSRTPVVGGGGGAGAGASASGNAGAGGARGGGIKNNKLIWRSFQSYNRFLDSWHDFQVGKDRPFWFSRVKSYGIGG
ncbi:MAG: hypothetical protein M1823_000382 [Watsoniomyces obsoletus]|nr:MAG: hypothetical protein M1823_000382 [Watsoniomyces obsoletus]